MLTDPGAMPEAAGPVGGERGERDDVIRALMALPLKQRRVVVLRHLLDLSEAQVAAELGIPIGTVKSTSSRALLNLRTSRGAVTNGSRT